MELELALLVLVGVIAACWRRFRIDKDKYDKRGEINFPYKKYFLLSWDNWVTNLTGGYVAYFAIPFIWYVYTFYKDGAGQVIEIPGKLEAGFAVIAGLLGSFVVDWLFNKVPKQKV